MKKVSDVTWYILHQIYFCRFILPLNSVLLYDYSEIKQHTILNIFAGLGSYKVSSSVWVQIYIYIYIYICSTTFLLYKNYDTF